MNQRRLNPTSPLILQKIVNTRLNNGKTCYYPEYACYNAGMSRRTPITDSPWFWAYLFGTAALIALALLSPKYGPRQAQLEREFQGRQRAAQNLNGQEPSIALSSADRPLISLRPLFFGLAAITAVAWIVFWLRRQLCVRDGQPVLASGGRQFASGGREPPETA
jgi:hypothetical protein